MNVADDAICYLNGQLLPLGECRISPLDRGFIFGDAVYEVIPVEAGTAFELEAHLARLDRSLGEIDLENPKSRHEWRRTIEQLIVRNHVSTGAIYLQVTRGVAPRNHSFPAEVRPTVFVMCSRSDASGATGPAHISAITGHDCRWARCYIKTTALMANVLLREQAARAGAGEIILHRDDSVTEGSSTNVFAVFGKAVVTPKLSNRILAGVTRARVVKLLQEHNVAVQESDIEITRLRRADEIWVTSSSRDIACVSSLDGEAVGDGRSYPLAERFFELLQSLKKGGASVS